LQSRSWIDEWLLGKLLLSAFEGQGLSTEEQHSALTLIKVLTSHQLWFETPPSGGTSSPATPRNQSKQNQATGKKALSAEAARVLRTLLGDTEVQETLRINRYQEILWFNAESLDQLLTGLYLIAVVDAVNTASEDPARCAQIIRNRKTVLDQIHEAKDSSNYQVERLLTALSG
jgi:hypothetical protein